MRPVVLPGVVLLYAVLLYAKVPRLMLATALLTCNIATEVPAQTDAAEYIHQGAAGRALRRTPVVEVYETWKDTVVCLTGATVKGDRPSAAEFFLPPATSGKHQPQIATSTGSGFVVHPAGYILTNAHAVAKVIAPQATFDVRSRKYWAELIAMSAEHDLALLKIDPAEHPSSKPLRFVRLAASGDLMIGETVVVIGNPHGLIRTCTAGVLSATDRAAQPDSPRSTTLRGLIQSDAALSPGSSGGPWFNVLGQVIGISTMVKAGPQRVGFAIPVATIRKLLGELLDVERRYGITTGLSVLAQRPCRVTAVAAGSPGASTSGNRAGVQPGDVLVQLGGWPITSGADFHLALVGRKPNDKLPLRLLRGGRPRNLYLTLGRRPKPDGAAMLKRKFGLGAVPLSGAMARAMALRGKRGVVITAVDAKLYATLKRPPLPGDVLGRINGIRPRDLDHVGLLLDRLKPGLPIPLVLLRLRGNAATRIDLQVTPRD